MGKVNLRTKKNKNFEFFLQENESLQEYQRILQIRSIH